MLRITAGPGASLDLLAAEATLLGRPTAFVPCCLFPSSTSVLLKLVICVSTCNEMTGLEALGILANIIQVVQASEAIVTRINDFRKATSDVPETFQRVSNRLVLLANTLKEIKEADTAGNIKEERALAIRPVIKDCAKLAESLQGLILKALPKKGDSEYKRGYKAVASFRYETDVLQIGKEIETSIQFLTFDNVVAANTQNVTREFSKDQSSMKSWPNGKRNPMPI